MTCSVCRGTAQVWDTAKEGLSVDCADGCGRFDLSGPLLAEMKTGVHRFDVEKTRFWLMNERLKSKDVPIIRVGNVMRSFCI